MAICRLVLMLPVILAGVALSLWVPSMSTATYRRMAAIWYRTMLVLTGIRIRYRDGVGSGTVLMVSNHVSWADILVLGARWPFTFLAMHEVGGWPVIGWLARQVGTLFIDRGRGAPGAIRQVTETLQSGESVILFPEGRTSPGNEIRRFHPRIFQAAVNAGVPVQPIALVYQDSGVGPGAGTRATFADGAGFLASLWRTLAGPRVTVDVVVCSLVGPMADRDLLAKAAREGIRAHLALQDPGSGADSGSETRLEFHDLDRQP